MLIVTNNPLLEDSMKPYAGHRVEMHPVSLRRLFELVRDKVHQGYRLETHPLSGSVKPHETCYKSIGMSEAPQAGLCLDSLLLIEQAIQACAKFPPRDEAFYQTHQADLQLLDWTLFQSALGSACEAINRSGIRRCTA